MRSTLGDLTACKIRGFHDEANGGRTNHVLLYRPDGELYNPLDLLLCNHDKFIKQAVKVETAPTDAEPEHHAKKTPESMACLFSLPSPASHFWTPLPTT
jgi:hypothetical protein